MAHADYLFYSTEYLGTVIAESAFDALALRASAVIDALTFGRAEPIVTAATETTTIAAIKNAMCAVAEEIYAIQNTDKSEYIKSESQGRYSVTYADSAVEGRAETERYSDAARTWLANTYLMFAGFNSGEYAGDPEL